MSGCDRRRAESHAVEFRQRTTVVTTGDTRRSLREEAQQLLNGEDRRDPSLEYLKAQNAKQRDRIEELEVRPTQKKNYYRKKTANPKRTQVENARLRALLASQQTLTTNVGGRGRRRGPSDRRILSAANAEGISRLVARDAELFGSPSEASTHFDGPKRPVVSWYDDETGSRPRLTYSPPGTPPPPEDPPPAGEWDSDLVLFGDHPLSEASTPGARSRRSRVEPRSPLSVDGEAHNDDESVPPRRHGRRRREPTPSYSTSTSAANTPKTHVSSAGSSTPGGRYDPLGSEDFASALTARTTSVQQVCGPSSSLSTPISQRRDHNPRGDASVWIAHDNRPLSTAISEVMKRGAAEVLVETKRSSQSICFVLGRVAYSGPSDGTDRVSGSLKAGARGAFLLEITKCYARVVDLAERSRPPASDFECLPLAPSQQTSIALDPATPVDLANADDVARFFADCDSRVDVVLSPQRLASDGRAAAPHKSGRPVSIDSAPWLPYWDTESPPRKLAPQFRSAGVGYLRLGDDMSRNGLAFVSADGATYLSDAGDVETTPTSLVSHRRPTAAQRAERERARRDFDNNNNNSEREHQRARRDSDNVRRLGDARQRSQRFGTRGGAHLSTSTPGHRHHPRDSSSLARAGASRLAAA